MYFLFKMDHTITEYHDTDRVERAEMIGELRRAQTSLGVVRVDERTQKDK